MTDDSQDAKFLFELADRLAPLLSASLYPVCSLENAARPVPQASAVCIAIAGRRFVVTASHVAAKAKTLPLAMILPTRIVRITGDWLATSPVLGDPNDRLDLAVLSPTGDLAALLADVAATPLTSIASFAPSQETASIRSGFFATMWFALTQQPRRFVSAEYKASVWRLMSEGSPLEEYVEAAANPEHHLLLEFDKDRVYTLEGPATAPDPVGVSGGAVWWLRVTDRGPDPRLVAIPVLWRPEARQIVATRMFVAMAGLWHAYPVLRATLDAAD